MSRWVNEEIWKHGIKNPPAKIKVSVTTNKEKKKDSPSMARFIPMGAGQPPRSYCTVFPERTELLKESKMIREEIMREAATISVPLFNFVYFVK